MGAAPQCGRRDRAALARTQEQVGRPWRLRTAVGDLLEPEKLVEFLHESAAELCRAAEGVKLATNVAHGDALARRDRGAPWREAPQGMIPGADQPIDERIEGDVAAIDARIVAEHRIERRAIALGLQAGNEFEVRSGLDGTEQIIASNPSAFREGQIVEVVSAQ